MNNKKLSRIERVVLSSKWFDKNRKKEISFLFNGINLGGLHILVVGAGATDFSAYFSDSRLTCIDYESFNSLDLRADATKLPFLNEKFDIILFLRVLHHINLFEEALSEADRCLKKGGYLLISEPSKMFVDFQKAIGFDSHPERIITASDLINFAQEKNFEIKTSRTKIFLFYYGYRFYKNKK